MDLPMIILTSVLVATTIAYTIGTFFLWGQTKEGVKLAKNSLDLAKQSYKQLQNTSEANTIVQLVVGNRALNEYAQRDQELMDVIRGSVSKGLTPKQYNYVSMIAGQIMLAFECKRMGVLSEELFAGMKTALGPMLASQPIRDAVREVCGVHPSLRTEIESWIAQVSRSRS